jgi:hypothetical protein
MHCLSNAYFKSKRGQTIVWFVLLVDEKIGKVGKGFLVMTQGGLSGLEMVGKGSVNDIVIFPPL